MVNLAIADGILIIPQPHGDDVLFPLICTDVEVEIHEQVAITTVRNSFNNNSGDSTRAIYHFRLLATALVVGFAVWRDSSFQQYDLRAGDQGGPGGGAGDNADLSEFLGENPFNMRLEDVPPGVFMTRVRYVQMLPYDFGVIRMSYPLYCGDWLVNEIDTISINIQIDAQRFISDVEVATFIDECEINTPGYFHADVSLNLKGVRPEEDLELLVTFLQEDIGAWLYTHRSDMDTSGFFMLVVDPGIVREDEQVQKYFTFVIDKSGSMRGGKLEQAKRAGNSCLDRLIDRDYFNIMFFNHFVESLFEEMSVVNDGNLAEASVMSHL